MQQLLFQVRLWLVAVTIFIPLVLTGGQPPASYVVAPLGDRYTVLQVGETLQIFCPPGYALLAVESIVSCEKEK